jgi:hypothetical protein
VVKLECNTLTVQYLIAAPSYTKVDTNECRPRIEKLCGVRCRFERGLFGRPSLDLLDDDFWPFPVSVANFGTLLLTAVMIKESDDACVPSMSKTGLPLSWTTCQAPGPTGPNRSIYISLPYLS